MNIGAHIPSKNAVEEIKMRKGDTFQIFVSSPQMWKSPKPREDLEELQDYRWSYICSCTLFNKRCNT
jgi:deoxyribonuclease-4